MKLQSPNWGVTGPSLETQPSAMWGKTGTNPPPQKTCHSVRVSPSDNYSSNTEVANEALIRMKMSQLARYQSISGESTFKQDIKDGGTVSSLFLITPMSSYSRHVALQKKKKTQPPIRSRVQINKKKEKERSRERSNTLPSSDQVEKWILPLSLPPILHLLSLPVFVYEGGCSGSHTPAGRGGATTSLSLAILLY